MTTAGRSAGRPVAHTQDFPLFSVELARPSASLVMKLTAHWPNDLEMPKVVLNVQFTMTNVQSILLIGQSVVEFIEVFRSMTNCRICRRIVMEHWPNANEKRCILHFTIRLSIFLTSARACDKRFSADHDTMLSLLIKAFGPWAFTFYQTVFLSYVLKGSGQNI